MSAASAVRAAPGGVDIHIKAVPGASRERLMGLLGDRLKVAVSAPPEGGKANDAICALLAAALCVPRKAVSVVAGHANPRKTVRVAGVGVEAARVGLGL